MSPAKIIFFPDPKLRKASQKVKSFDTPELDSIVEILSKTMTSQPAGIGIAAPQIGIPLRIAIVDVSSRVQGASRLVLINPKIVEARHEGLSREGCMSLPEYSAYLKRYQRIQLVWHNERGKRLEKHAEGIEAVCIQHEIDHLDGILFIDRVASLKTDMIPRKGKER